jgi:hypothetical protein
VNVSRLLRSLEVAMGVQAPRVSHAS